MAITRTTTVERIEVYPAADSSAADTLNRGNPTVMCVYHESFDDTSDADLPTSTPRVKHLVRYSDEENATATDLSSEHQLVQDVCGAIWTSSE